MTVKLQVCFFHTYIPVCQGSLSCLSLTARDHLLKNTTTEAHVCHFTQLTDCKVMFKFTLHSKANRGWQRKVPGPTPAKRKTYSKPNTGSITHRTMDFRRAEQRQCRGKRKHSSSTHWRGRRRTGGAAELNKSERKVTKSSTPLKHTLK